MKILAKIGKTSEKYALIHLIDETVRRKIKKLISKGKYSQAIGEALKKGKFYKEISGPEKNHIEARLILTEKSAHWDLTV